MRALTIGEKLFLSFGAALTLTLVVSAVSLRGFTQLGATMRTLIEEDAREQFLAGEVDVVLADFLAEERGIIRRAEMGDKATVAKYDGDFRESVSRIGKRMAEMAQLVRTAEGRVMLDQIRAATAQIARNHADFMEMLSSDDLKRASPFVTDTVMPLIKRTSPVAEKLLAHEREIMIARGNEAEALVARSRWITIAMIALALAVAAVVASIVRHTNRGLRRIVNELAEGAEQTTRAANQVSASSDSLAQGSSEQAASLEETSGASEKIDCKARENSQNSKTVANLVQQSQEKCVGTTSSLHEMIRAMGEIVASSEKISKIIRVIEEIAFQTNILALNAAVESARAGEAGTGFAVVADEVRNLAQRTAQAAKDTTNLIEESIAKSREGKSKVDQVVVAIEDISEESTRVNALVQKVSLGSEQQERGVAEISKAITQMSQVTQSIAASAEESAAAAEELNAQSEAMRDVVRRLSSMVSGGGRNFSR